MTAVVAALIVAAWVAIAASGSSSVAAVLGGIIPARLSGAEALAGAVPAWLTPVTACFLHSGVLHLGVNVLMLIFCGKPVESAIGEGLLAILLLAGAYASAVAEMLWSPSGTTVIIGASGAISALVAVYALLYNQQDIRGIGPFSSHVVRLAWLAAAWIGLQMLMGFAFGGRIAVVAHMGGFIAGLLLARPMLRLRFRAS